MPQCESENRLNDIKLANERDTQSAFMNVLGKIAKSIGMKGEIEECEYIRDAVRVGIADPCGINMGNREKKPTLKYRLTPIGGIFLHSVQIRENAPSKRDFVEEVRMAKFQNRGFRNAKQRDCGNDRPCVQRALRR